ncbi:MAG: bifunctional [glutamate--ammonia ligase]-adenylyl-L-tyrosine phosphorylase/[glutamate--ammonia-ligase] adenylyltransferase [Verrucomicrobia bacterium]|nr:MAG: bifunctional [glutamate--ammonia ligase]-adenylyl-L-tyrosine phosphorylase/[glutamate--ammonia-ligase] adenylyltransferase [Verrucomicrobiota bacterium]
MFRVMDRGDRWIWEKAAASLNPSQVENTLLQLSETWPPAAPPIVDVIEKFPLGEAALLHLLAMSSICATRLVRHPEILLWLGQPDACLSARGYEQMANDLRALAGDSIAAENFRALRFWKGREMARIALRELADVAPLEETTAELSQLAEICLSAVFKHWNSELRQRSGSPDAEFTMLALGKLGGGELNHSSDVDLIFLYSNEGQVSPRLSYHEFFNRLGKKILETFATRDPEGPLFRIDLRLRPEGSAGPLACSLESMEHYYGGFGETWERLALIKTRGICGSRELAYEFLRQHQPFIYPSSPTPDLLDEIASIKRRIERDIVGQENLGRNVKLGAGGIREIEFIVQALQLIHGARHAFLQEPSMLKALRALHQLDLLPRDEVVKLDEAYRFLRRVEHRLQIDAEQQTHTVPQEPAVLRRLALSLGFSSSREFTGALQKRMRNVRSIFRRVISEKSAEAKPIDLAIFSDQRRATKALADLAQASVSFHIAPRTRQIFRKLRPLLLDWLAKAADPDATLNQFVRFVQAYGLRSLLFELLVTNPRLLELLVKTFDASQFAGSLLIRRPQLLEDVTRSENLDRGIAIEEHLRRLASLDLTRASLDGVRAYRQTELLRIVLRDVLGLVDLAKLLAEHSALAEACLLFVNRLLGSEELTIIALGKFGGREIGYGADLDVLFVGEDIRAAQNLVVAMAQPSAEGNLPTLDARLRPDGDKGPLVCSLAAYESYYLRRAQLWELHALTRARSVTSPLQDQFIDMAQRCWRETSQRADLFNQIDNMLERIRRERGSGHDFLDFKTGAGGIIEAEFLVHALQMKAEIWNPNWNDALEQLHECGVLPAAQAADAKRGYEFLGKQNRFNASERCRRTTKARGSSRL